MYFIQGYRDRRHIKDIIMNISMKNGNSTEIPSEDDETNQIYKKEIFDIGLKSITEKEKQIQQEQTGIQKRITELKTSIKQLPAGRHLLHKKKDMEIELQSLESRLTELFSKQEIYTIADVLQQTNDMLADVSTIKEKNDDYNDINNIDADIVNDQNSIQRFTKPVRKKRKAFIRNVTDANIKKTCIDMLKNRLQYTSQGIKSKQSSKGAVPALVNSVSTCIDCQGKLMLDTMTKKLVCTTCCTEYSSSHTFQIQNLVTNSQGYKREIYFIDLLRSECGFLCPLSKAQIEQIHNYILKQNQKVSVSVVDHACKQLGMNKLAKYRVGITERLTGRRTPLKYTPKQMQELLNKFHPMHLSFERLKQNNSIKNRMNFPYALFHYELLKTCKFATKNMLKTFRLPDAKPLKEQLEIFNLCKEDCIKRGVWKV